MVVLELKDHSELNQNNESGIAPAKCPIMSCPHLQLLLGLNFIDFLFQMTNSSSVGNGPNCVSPSAGKNQR